MTKRKAASRTDKTFSIKNRLSNLEEIVADNYKHVMNHLTRISEQQDKLTDTASAIQKAVDRAVPSREPGWYTIHTAYVPMPYWWNGERWELWFVGNKFIASYDAYKFSAAQIGEKIKTPIGRP